MHGVSCVSEPNSGSNTTTTTTVHCTGARFVFAAMDVSEMPCCEMCCSDSMLKKAPEICRRRDSFWCSWGSGAVFSSTQQIFPSAGSLLVRGPRGLEGDDRQSNHLRPGETGAC